MSKVARKEHEHEHEHEREGEIVPIRPTFSLPMPRWMERFEEMLERPFGPFPMLRWPEELAGVKVPPIDVYEEGDSLVVKHYEMKGGNGTAEGEGSVRFAGLTNPIVDLRLRAQKFRAIDHSDFLTLTT